MKGSNVLSARAQKMTAAHAYRRGLRICSASCVAFNLENPMQPKLPNQLEASRPSFYFVADSSARGLLNKQENHRATCSDDYRPTRMV